MRKRNEVRIKSYFAKSVDQAISQARLELGDDALLLNTLKVPGQGGFSGGYEVTFGSAEEPESEASESFGRAPSVAVKPAEKPVEKIDTSPSRPELFWLEALRVEPVKIEPVKIEAPKMEAPKTETARPEPKPEPVPDTSSRREFERLQTQMDEIRALLVQSGASRSGIGRSVPELADVYARLMAAEWDAGLARDIVDRLEASLSTDAFFLPAAGREKSANRWKSLRCDQARMEAFVRAELARRVAIDARLGRVMAVVGPTGAGKTTTLMKIASMNASPTAPVRILTLDVSRTLGLGKLAAFTGQPGISVTSVPALDLLPPMVAEARKRETVLIDTPGFSGNGYSGNMDVAAGALSNCADIDVHLVVPGYMRSGDLARCIQRYQIFRPSRLLVTKLDETEALGTAVSQAVKADLSLSMLTHGPATAGEIRKASIDDLVAMALGHEAARAECA